MGFNYGAALPDPEIEITNKYVFIDNSYIAEINRAIEHIVY